MILTMPYILKVQTAFRRLYDMYGNNTYVRTTLKIVAGREKKNYRLVLPHSKQPNSFSFTTQENTKSGLASPSATSGRVSHEIRQRRISCLRATSNRGVAGYVFKCMYINMYVCVCVCYCVVHWKCYVASFT